MDINPNGLKLLKYILLAATIFKIEVFSIDKFAG